MLLSLVVVLGTVFSDYEKVTATGISEIMYYTYWDLINTIYATCGYEMSVSDAEINNHGVTGKQAWDNFCTAVEGTAKFHGKLFKGAMTEMYDLAKNATQKGISMSQDLYDMLKDALCDTSSSVYKNNFDTSSGKSICAFVGGVVGCSNYSSSSLVDAVRAGKLISIVKYGTKYNIIYLDPSKELFVDYRKKDSAQYFCSYVYDVKRHEYKFDTVGGDAYRSDSGSIHQSVSLGTAGLDCQILFKNGSFYYDKTISAKQVNEGACPKEVPESIPWRKEKSIPDGWRVVPQEVPDTGTDTDPGKEPGKEPEKEPDKEPDKKPKENPDILPVEIPLLPFSPSVPDTKPLETPDKDPDKEPAKDPDKEPAKDPDKKPEKQPGILVNPLTGNYIDPVTGYDIDPKTGLLIDPETGELIDPKNLPDSDDDSGGGGGGSGGLPGAVSGFGDITKLFPFCIPFDIIRLIQGMKAQEAPPVFHFEYHFDSINYTFSFDVDLSDYAKYIKIFRFGMQIFYALALMFLTLKVSKIFI